MVIQPPNKFSIVYTLLTTKMSLVCDYDAFVNSCFACIGCFTKYWYACDMLHNKLGTDAKYKKLE